MFPIPKTIKTGSATYNLDMMTFAYRVMDTTITIVYFVNGPFAGTFEPIGVQHGEKMGIAQAHDRQRFSNFQDAIVFAEKRLGELIHMDRSTIGGPLNG